MQVLALLDRCHSLRLHTPQLKKKNNNNNNNNNLVKQWKNFWSAFTMLNELRMILHQNVIWFDCSATLNKKTKQLILFNADFWIVDSYMYQTEVVWISVNQSDVSICMKLILCKKLDSFELLYFLLDASTDFNNVTISDQISKTIIFIDD